ncbi:MAG: hypothetical protein M1838_000688 [Thelocarpon superellum]|nr:MAG: hypothetical protein M1838_000688 [Thelocarpon superellum]
MASNTPQEDTPPGGSASLDRLTHGVKPYVEAINDLRRQGVEDLIPSLPKIVVVGDQSTGKSSLIEAMSEIKVPRDVGTCTRCPLEINLTENNTEGAQWACKVSLHMRYMYDPLFESQKSDRRFGNFVPQLPEDVAFETIHSKDEVEKVISQAQQAILNPHENPMKYRHDDGLTHHLSSREQFSPNVVRLDISGPNLPNLSFTDLPGVIQEADNDDHGHVVSLVENLVKSYIRDDNSLVLLARPMTEDANNSTAGRYVKEVQADERCIGVLTKPDLIRKLSHKKWGELLAGKSFKQGHGYFVTRQPERGLRDQTLSHEQARTAEADFFRREAPWNTEFLPYADRFGTEKLQLALSEKLTSQIKKSIPLINEQVRKKVEQIEQELQTLPDPPSEDLPRKLQGQLDKMGSELQHYLDDAAGYHTFHKQWNQLALAFRQLLMATRPDLHPDPAAGLPRPRQRPRTIQAAPETPTPSRKNNRVESFQIVSSGDEATPVKREPDSNKRKRSGPAPIPTSTPQKRPKQAGANPISRFRAVVGTTFTLTGIREELCSGRTTGMPGLIDSHTVDRLSRQSAAHWKGPMLDFVDMSAELLRQQVMARLEDALGSWKPTKLFEVLVSLIQSCLERWLKDERDEANAIFDLEMRYITTLDQDGKEKWKLHAEQRFQKMRLELRINEALDEDEGDNVTEGSKREAKVAKFDLKRLGKDEFWQEVDIVAHVRGYHEIALWRFVDNIHRRVLGNLFLKCRKLLVRSLVEGLGLERADAQEHCAYLMAEDPHREARRVQLKKEKERLHRAQDRLAVLG